MPTIADDLGLTRDEWSMVRGICGRCAGGADGIEDLEQEASLHLFEKRHAYEALVGSARRSTIRRIVHNRLVSVHRAEPDAQMVELREDMVAVEMPESPDVQYVPLRPWVCVRHQWILRQLAEGRTTRQMAADAGCSQRKIQRLVKGAREVVSVYWQA